jgi:hypothetical protein
LGKNKEKLILKESVISLQDLLSIGAVNTVVEEEEEEKHNKILFLAGMQWA